MAYSLSAVVFETRMTVMFSFSVITILVSAFTIVWILLQIELNKAAMFLVEEDDVIGGDKNSLDLSLEESTSPKNKVDGLETEPPPPTTSTSESQLTKQQQSQGESSSGGESTNQMAANGNNKSMGPSTKKGGDAVAGRQRRLPKYFVIMQFASVSALTLLTYLLLVVSSAPITLSTIGSLCVVGMFFRYQVGEELRRQRLDRLFMILSLFLAIASGLSLATYAGKSLSRGEVYEGPARIVGYDYSNYSNSQNEPVTRTDLMVNWGDEWGCPESGGKICSANVKGAMCQADQPVNDDRRRKMKWIYRGLAADDNDEGADSNNNADEDTAAEGEALEEAEENEVELEEDLEDEENEAQTLEEQNAELEEENEELKEELEEMTEKETAMEDEEEVVEEEAETEIIEVEDEYDEALLDEEEIADEYAEAYEEAVEEEYYDEEVIEDLESENDDATNFDDLETEAAAEEASAEDNVEVDEEYQDEVIEYEDEVEDYELEDEEMAAEEEEEVELYEEGYSEEEVEEIVEEEEEEGLFEYDDAWWADDYYYEFDDDYYEDEYWQYDWDSVWGEYGCTDLFDSDMEGFTFDESEKPGEDDWPFVNIYGSCKTCDAYLLDYFAEEAFEKLDGFRTQGIFYGLVSLSGMAISVGMYLRYRASPTAENEIELLSNDGGVIA